MAVIVFDADVLIAYLGRDDAHHAQAVERMRHALEPGTRRLVSAVNYSEVLIGPLQKAGAAGAETVDAMFVRFGIETIQVDMAMARRAAAVRAGPAQAPGRLRPCHRNSCRKARTRRRPPRDLRRKGHQGVQGASPAFVRARVGASSAARPTQSTSIEGTASDTGGLRSRLAGDGRTARGRPAP